MYMYIIVIANNNGDPQIPTIVFPHSIQHMPLHLRKKEIHA